MDDLVIAFLILDDEVERLTIRVNNLEQIVGLAEKETKNEVPRSDNSETASKRTGGDATE